MITHGIHLNMDAYILENDFLVVKVLKEFGGKIASIYHKELEYEVLFQPTDNSYRVPELGGAFSDYDTSGIDEMLPTIDECYYPNSYKKMNDHGDIWAQKWNYKEDGNVLISNVRCDSIKLDLIRSISLDGESILLDYKLYNPTSQELYYLWAFHGLMNFDDSTELEFFTDSQIENVIDGSAYDFNYLKLGDYPDGGSYKFYFVDEIENGKVKVLNRNNNLLIEFNYDTEINKFLGVWITKGGFKGEYNFAIEPTSGYYDSLERAYINDKVSKVDSKETKEWKLKLDIRKWR